MERLDGEIGVLENELNNLKAALSRPKVRFIVSCLSYSSYSAPFVQKHRQVDSHKSLAERVYDENREKAAASVEPFAHLGVSV